MIIEIKVPGVGESVQEGMIESWQKKEGDYVKQDEIILELETDKATVEVVAEASGVLHIGVEAGANVKVGDVIGTIDSSAVAKDTSDKKDKSKVIDEDKKNSGSSESTSDVEDRNGPAARRLTAEHEINTDTILGTGKDGRVTKQDILSKEKSEDKQQMQTIKTETQLGDSSREISSNSRTTRREPMSMIRKRISQRLLEAQQSAAILTTFNEVDMSALQELRVKYKDLFQKKHDVKLGFMGFFLKAAVDALKTYPTVNAYIQGDDIVYHDYCDVGVAVSTKKGLLVPVIRNVEKMSLAEVEKAISAYAQKARDNKISIDDLSGGTFTVSNGGVFGSLLSTPIINPPQTAILGMHTIQKRPVVNTKGEIEVRPMMYLALSYDHRLIDGKQAVSFLIRIKECLEEPSRLIIGV